MGREWLGISVAVLVLIVNYAQAIQGELWNINSILKKHQPCLWRCPRNDANPRYYR